MKELLSRKGVSLDRLRAFLEVYEAGGIARAAPGEPIRQSQLSRQLSQLETALGQLLLLRAGRRLIPGGPQRRLAVVVRELRTGLADALEVSGGRRVRLAAGDSVLCWLLLPFLRRIYADCPGIHVEIRAAVGTELVRALDEHQLDMGLLRSGVPAAALKTLRLGKIGYALFGARHHRNLRSAPLAVPTSERALLPALVRLGQPSVECETFAQVAAAVRSGEVAGVLPAYARRELSDPHYHREDLPELGASALLLAWRPRLDELRPELKAVRRAIEQLVREQLAGRS